MYIYILDFTRKTDALMAVELLLETCICTLNKPIKTFFVKSSF